MVVINAIDLNIVNLCVNNPLLNRRLLGLNDREQKKKRKENDNNYLT